MQTSLLSFDVGARSFGDVRAIPQLHPQPCLPNGLSLAGSELSAPLLAAIISKHDNCSLHGKTPLPASRLADQNFEECADNWCVKIGNELGQQAWQRSHDSGRMKEGLHPPTTASRAG